MFEHVGGLAVGLADVLGNGTGTPQEVRKFGVHLESSQSYAPARAGQGCEEG